jgi:hypothetical protein
LQLIHVIVPGAAKPESAEKSETTKEEAMDVDDPASEGAGAGAEFLQSVLEGLPSESRPAETQDSPQTGSSKSGSSSKSDKKSNQKKK